jgi:hypothetical protein
MTLPSALTGRTAALAALVSAILVCVALLVLVLGIIRSSTRAGSVEALRRLAAYQGEIDSRPAVEAAFAQLRRRAAGMPGLVHARDDAQAAAQVETAVKAIAASTGGDLRSAQMLPPAYANGFDIVAVECDVTVPASRLRDVAYAIETHRPYLFIARADITAPMIWNAKSDPDPTIGVQWVLRAYRRADEK